MPFTSLIAATPRLWRSYAACCNIFAHSFRIFEPFMLSCVPWCHLSTPSLSKPSPRWQCPSRKHMMKTSCSVFFSLLFSGEHQVMEVRTVGHRQMKVTWMPNSEELARAHVKMTRMCAWLQRLFCRRRCGTLTQALFLGSVHAAILPVFSPLERCIIS